MLLYLFQGILVPFAEHRIFKAPTELTAMCNFNSNKGWRQEEALAFCNGSSVNRMLVHLCVFVDIVLSKSLKQLVHLLEGIQSVKGVALLQKRVEAQLRGAYKLPAGLDQT